MPHDDLSVTLSMRRDRANPDRLAIAPVGPCCSVFPAIGGAVLLIG